MAKKKRTADKTLKASSFLLSLQPTVMAQLSMLVAAILAVYLHTLDVPFYLDDYPSIRENLAIRNISDLDAIANFSGARVLGYLSFALNYLVHEYNLAGYHIVNILIHIAASVIVFFIVSRLVVLSDVELEIGELAVRWLPLVAALIFALHPLQTQAVTYIVQRLASMTAMFYLLGLLLYVIGRTSNSNLTQCLGVGFAVLMAAAALYTKQNSATFPAAIFLLELCFLGFRGKRLLLATVIGVLLLLLSLGYLFFFVDEGLLQSLSQATLETTLVSRVEYLAIQMGVLWIYLSKFLLPLGQQFDMELPVTSFMSPITIVFAIGHIAALGTAFWLLKKRPLLAFSIMFYYLTHSVESSIVPIRDFAFEHRTYLPNFGLGIFLSYMLLVLLPQKANVNKLEVPLIAMLVFFSVLTWDRNNTWRNPEIFFRHEIAMNSNSLRSYGMLGEYYLRAGENQKAVRTYLQGLEIAEPAFDRQNNTEVAYYQNTILALDNADQDEEAIRLIDSVPWQEFGGRVQSKFATLRGNLYAQQFKIVEAQSDFEQALALDSRNMDAKSSYGKILYMQARMDESRRQFQELLEIDPNHPLAGEAETLLQAIEDYEAGQ